MPSKGGDEGKGEGRGGRGGCPMTDPCERVKECCEIHNAANDQMIAKTLIDKTQFCF